VTLLTLLVTLTAYPLLDRIATYNIRITFVRKNECCGMGEGGLEGYGGPGMHGQSIGELQ
jgi:hypothetical protein